MQSPSEHLRALIREQGGLISVARFMEEALYHPAFGYYAKRVRGIGAGSDFSTSATLHPALPQAIAAWAVNHRAEIASGNAWHLIELGGGGGQMAEALLRAVSWFRRFGLHYHLIEISESLRVLQQEKLAPFRRHVSWHRDIAEALAAANGRALIFSNEFVDAFPCLQLVRNGGMDPPWSEVKVAWPEELTHPSECLVAWENPTVGQIESSVLSPEYGQLAKPGQRVEIHRAYQQWLCRWLPLWRSGRMLTIDYGDCLPDVYLRRPGGSLRAYAHHQRITGSEVYRNVGQQDLTADVNFTDLAAWGNCSGLQETGYCTQSQFLQRWHGQKRISEAAKRDQALAFLVDDAGAGGAFKVLEQRRNEK